MIQKHKYLSLDAIRGVAAMFVLALHGPELFGGVNFPKSYLAVDLFFVMSGFVLSAAYDKNLLSRKLSVIEFIKIRLIRLYPLYFLALIPEILGKFYIELHSAHLNLMDFAFEIVLSLFMIPSPTPGTYLFPLNPLSWTIFFELIVNGLYARFRSYLTNKMMFYVMAGSAAMLTIFVFLNHSVNFGFSWKNSFGGLPRVIYS